MSKPIFLSIRDGKGRMYSVNPFAIQADLPDDVKQQAQDLIRALALAPKRPRGRPVGYKCSPETVAQMVASRQATLAAKREAH